MFDTGGLVRNLESASTFDIGNPGYCLQGTEDLQAEPRAFNVKRVWRMPLQLLEALA